MRWAIFTRVLTLGMLGVFVVFMLGSCGGGGESAEQQQPKERTLPNLSGPLPPGTYASQAFKPPLSLTLVEKGWAHYNPELPDRLDIARERSARQAEQGAFLSLGITFFNVREVVDYPSQELARTPDDMAAWLQNHPGLDAAKPVRTKIGGVPGVRIDTQRPSEAVVLFQLSNGDQWGSSTKDKYRFIVLDAVEGETVTIAVGGPAGQFGELLPEAQEVLKTVEWKGT
jgi:hypothetical protein